MIRLAVVDEAPPEATLSEDLSAHSLFTSQMEV